VDLASRFKDKTFDPDGKISLVGVVKEVVEDPKKDVNLLGLVDFQTKYFLDYPVYIDKELKLFSALDAGTILGQLFYQTSWWNPFALYRGASSIGERLKTKGVENILGGEGNIKGGIIMVHPTRGVTYVYKENTGDEIPLDEIAAALADLTREE